MGEQKIGQAEKKSRQILKEAHAQAESIRKEANLGAKELSFKVRTDFDKEANSKRKELLTANLLLSFPSRTMVVAKQR